MAYDTESILTSKLPYKVLREIAIHTTKEEPEIRKKGNYSAKIAKDLDRDQSLVSEIISRLFDLDLLLKGDRKRAQYYLINPAGLANYVVDTLKQEIKPSKLDKFENEKIQKHLEELSEQEEKVAQTESSTKLASLVFYFSIYYMINIEDSTIERMLVKDLPSGVKASSDYGLTYEWFDWFRRLCELSEGTREPAYLTELALGEMDEQGIIDYQKDIEEKMKDEIQDTDLDS